MKKTWLIVAALALAVAWHALHSAQQTERIAAPVVQSTPAGDAASAPQTPARAANASTSFLPPEATTTLQLIARGGPFPHRQDGVVFQNRERRLPSEPNGYYHEYTVETPGAGNRGTRRIITGGTPPSAYWYTDDHYETFRSIPVKASDASEVLR